MKDRRVYLKLSTDVSNSADVSNKVERQISINQRKLFIRTMIKIIIFSGQGVSFPNFRRFYLQEGGFDFSVPPADLELTKFSINEDARNFPEEAVERGRRGSIAASQTEEGLVRSKRHIPGEFLYLSIVYGIELQALIGTCHDISKVKPVRLV